MASDTILERYRRKFALDRELHGRAKLVFPDGVTHDLRETEPFPIYIDYANGSKKWGIDRTEFIDYWSGHGALLLGHNPSSIVEAVNAQMRRGTHYGACNKLELEWAEAVIELVPSAERIRFTSSGTEATLMAIRLARSFTGKNKILKFAGHFHGWHDSLILGANPPFDREISGIPKNVADQTLIVPPNDLSAVEKILQKDKEIAGVILEATGASFGQIPTNGDFLRELRQLTSKYGTLLIFDEVITGFRIAPGGAQEFYKVTPDLTALGKILAGGLPGGAVAGKSEILNLISIGENRKNETTQKRMPHQGTFNANPISAVAGIEMLQIAKTGKPQKHATEIAQLLRQNLNEVVDRHKLDWAFYGEFSSLRFLISHGVHGLPASEFDPYKWDYRKLKGGSNNRLVKMLRCSLLLNGIDMTDHGGMTSAAHTKADIEKTAESLDRTIDEIKKEVKL